MSSSRSGIRSKQPKKPKKTVAKARPREVPKLANEAELLVLVQKGDMAAFGRVYRHYAAALEDFAMHYVSSRDTAKDIVHETFFRIWQKHAGWAPVSMEAYLFGAVRNRSIKILRREGFANDCHAKWLAVGASPAMGKAPPTGEEAVKRAEIMAAINLAIAKLPKCTQATAKLRWFEGLSRNEIARTLNVAERTVGSRLVRAGHLMRAALASFET